MEESDAEAPHVTHLTEADFLVDDDYRVQGTVAEAPLEAHLTEADFLIDEDDRLIMEETVAEAPHVANLIEAGFTEWRKIMQKPACCSPYRI
jgi:hypothetical protein